MNVKLTPERIKDRIDYAAFFRAQLGELRSGSNGNAQALCPFHDDRMPSLSVNLETGLWNCFGCEAKGDVFDFYMKLHGCDFSTALRDLARLAGLDPDEARPRKRDQRGLTLAQFAGAKKLPVDFLTRLGVREVRGKDGKPYLIFEYRDRDGNLIPEASRLRFSLAEKPRAKKGGKPMAYGLWEIPAMLAEDGELIVAEGESDWLTGRYYGLPILTLPGKTMTRLLDPRLLTGFKTIYVWQEPGAEDFPLNVACALPGFMVKRLVPPPPIKDLSDLHCRNLEVLPMVRQMQQQAVEVNCTSAREPGFIISAGHLLSLSFDPDDEIIGGGILPAGGGLILAGESGEGKSLLRLELALCLAMGIDRLGLQIPQQRRVLIIQNENPEKQEAYRLQRMLTGLGLDQRSIENRLIYSNPQLRFNLGYSNDIAKLSEIIQESQAEVVIYDPLSSFHNVNENDNIAIRNILDNITMLNRTFNITAIVVHHFGKPTEISTNAHRTRGASSIKDWADTLMTLTRKKHEHKILRILEFLKVRNGPEPKPIILERDEFFLHHPVEDSMLCPPEKVREIVRNHGGEVVGYETLKQLISQAVNCSPRSASTFIKTALERGAIISLPSNGGRKKIYVPA